MFHGMFHGQNSRFWSEIAARGSREYVLTMLIEFRVTNHRSIRDEQGITFEARGDRKDPRVRQVGKHHLLPVAAIYGANASGKSNVLTALQWMRDAVVDSFSGWSPGGGVPRQPFAWGEARQRPSTFEAVFFIDGIHHTYGFIVDDKAVLEEWLWVRPHGRKQVWFERKGQHFTFGEQLKGENEVIRAVTRPNALLLSVAAQMNHPQLGDVFQFFFAMEFARPVSDGFGDVGFPDFLEVMDALKDDGFSWLLPLLQAADVGIEDIRLGNDGIELRHRTDSSDPAWLPLEEESHGTKRLMELGRSLRRRKSVLVIDEIEAGLHPLLVRTVLDLFQKPELNPKNAQLLFTTHDTLLLGTLLDDGPLLRRDQVWLAEKGPDGASEVVPLSVYSPRKGENLERAYLQGRYRAVPLINRSRFGVD